MKIRKYCSMFHSFCHSIPCPSWTDNTVKSGQFLSPSGLWGKWVRKIQKTSLEANSTIFVIVYILANYCSLSTCWLALSGQFLNPKMGNKSKLKISKLRIIIHQPNDNLSVESKRSSKTKKYYKYQISIQLLSPKGWWFEICEFTNSEFSMSVKGYTSVLNIKSS